LTDWIAESKVTKRIDLFDNTYSHFTEQVLEAIRKETFGKDIGQNSWLTADEYDRFISWLRLVPEHHVLEVASGSGGPALYLAHQTSCYVTGIDANESGIATANQSAVKSNLWALRSSIGFFLFVPPGVNEQLIEKAGFHLVQQEDVTENAALVSGRWHQARQRHKDALLQAEGEERFEGLQQFFTCAYPPAGNAIR
jgi:hypothetical protein